MNLLRSRLSSRRSSKSAISIFNFRSRNSEVGKVVRLVRSDISNIDDTIDGNSSSNELF